MRYDRFKESCQMLMDEGKEEYVLVASDIKGFKFINEAIGYTRETISCVCSETC